MATQLMGDDSDVREGVAKPCARLPGRCWRDRDRRIASRAEFVRALQPSYLAILIPDAFFEAANACVRTHRGFGFANLIPPYLAKHILGLPRSS